MPWNVSYGDDHDLAALWRGDNDIDQISDGASVAPFIRGLMRNNTPRATLQRGQEAVIVDYEEPDFLLLHYDLGRLPFVEQVVMRRPAARADRVYSREGVDMLATGDSFLSARELERALTWLLFGRTCPPELTTRRYSALPADGR